VKWSCQFSIAQVCVRITSDSNAFQQEIGYLTNLYTPDSQTEADIIFYIQQREGGYALLLENEVLWQSDDPRDIPPTIELEIYRQVLLKLEGELISLHASTVSVGRSACIFAGVSGAGKSSLCTAALLDEAVYLTDEFSLLGKEGCIHPFPRPLQWDSIKHPAFEVDELLDGGLFEKGMFSFPTPEGDILTSHLWFPKYVQQQPILIKALVFPRYHAEANAASLTPIRRGEALVSLLEHVHSKRAVSESLSALNQRLPLGMQCFRLDFSDVFAAWREVKNMMQSEE